MRMATAPAPPPAGVGPLRPARGVAGAPLREPAVYRSHDGVLNVTLVASSRVVRIAGRQVVAKVYNGSWVAPTLSIAPGDLVEIRLVNHLHEPTNLHFHGLEISPGGHADNIFVTVDPGHSFRYRFRLPRDAPTGTFWYHSHLMVPAREAARYPNAASEEQVFDGLSGLIEVRGLTHDLPASLREPPQRYLALRDVQVHADRQAQGDAQTHRRQADWGRSDRVAPDRLRCADDPAGRRPVQADIDDRARPDAAVAHRQYRRRHLLPVVAVGCDVRGDRPGRAPGGPPRARADAGAAARQAMGRARHRRGQARPRDLANAAI